MADKKMVYLDQAQCRRFNLGYYDPKVNRVVLATAEVIDSKGGDGYDEPMLKLLKEQPPTITLEREHDFGPGWWCIGRRMLTMAEAVKG